ncbi:MAG: tetratricopeptide repeat protein [Armatimonadota bacterium]
MQDSGGDGRGAAIAQDYLKLLTRDPDSLRFAEYADHLRGIGKLSDATRVCEHGLMRHPAYSTGHVVMAAILLDAGMHDRGAAELQEALRLDPGHPRARLMLGKLLLDRGESASAIGEFEIALLHHPGLAEARARLAEIRGEVLPSRSEIPPEKPDAHRKPGERPAWLTSVRAQDAVTQALRCSPITSAVIADADGRALAASETASCALTEGERMVGFVNDLRALASRIAAGRVRSAIVSTPLRRRIYLPLGDLVLAASADARGNADATITQLDQAVAEDQRAPAEGSLDD